jgi:hypothetical protein
MEEEKPMKITNEIDKKIEIIQKVLENVCEIMTLFKPLLEKLLELEEAKQYSRNGTLDKAALLFGEIAKQCNELQKSPYSDEFLNNLEN